MKFPKINFAHVLTFLEVGLLSAVPAWVQSPTGSAFLHGHQGIADAAWAAYTGYRAVSQVRAAKKAATAAAAAQVPPSPVPQPSPLPDPHPAAGAANPEKGA